MGATVSVEAPLSHDAAAALFDEAWNEEMESKFEELAGEDGLVTVEDANAFIKNNNSERPISTGMCSRGTSTSKWIFMRAAQKFKEEILFDKNDLQNDTVSAFMTYIDGTPDLAEQNLDDLITDSVLTDQDRNAIHEARRARLRLEAEAHLAKAAEMGLTDIRHVGDLDHYTPENQAKREAIFDDDLKVNKLLDQWWRACTIHLDSDNDDTLSLEEYKLFHRRLLRIVEKDNHMELTDEEALAMMEDDFKADSAADGSVDKEEFRWSVFQLADQWTTSVDVEEYVAFLEMGFEIVFSDLIAADKLVLPSCWKKALKKTKTITALPEARVVDMLSGILHDKIKADQSDLKKGTKLEHLADYSVEWFNTQYGSGAAMKKQFKSFVTGLLKMVDDNTSLYNDYGLLFCQMAGIGTPSGRIKALPPDASQKLQLHLDDIQALCSVGKGTLLDDAKKLTRRQPSIKRDDKKASLPRRGSSKSEIKRTVSNGSSKALVRGGANSRTTYLVSGFIETSKAEIYLNRILSEDLGCDSSDPLCRVTALSLQVLSTKTANVKGGSVPSVQCMSFTVLMGIIFAAWGTRNVDKEASK